MKDTVDPCPLRTGDAYSAPRAYPVVGHLPFFVRDKLGFLLRCAESYPDVVKLRIGAPTYLLTNPQDISYVLRDNERNYEKSPRIIGGKRKSLFGKALIATPSDSHRSKRHALQPLFQRKAIEQFADAVISRAEQMLARWQHGVELDIAQEMLSVSQQIIVKTIFGSDCGEQAETLCNLLEIRRHHIEHVLGSVCPFSEYLPSRLNNQYRRATKQFDEIIFRMIKEQRGNADPARDIFSMLMRTRYDDGTTLSDEEIRDETLTLALAGYETISQALTWTWYLLSQNPKEESRLLSELHTVLSGRMPLVSDLQNLPYTAMVFSESLRLYPPTWLFVRIAQRDDALPSGAAITGGSKIYLSPFITQRNPRYFPNPERFIPERFSEDAKRSRPKFAYFPFGGGPRQCIGEGFATMEGMLLIASIASRFKLELSEGQQVMLEAGITLRPRNGLIMRLQQR
ncbi:MAG: cytochrome P450 [Pyrinomonadaceae bacterium]